jgi:hypothetical protein
MDAKLVFCEAMATGTITHNDALPIDEAVTNLKVATNVIDLGDTATTTRDGGDKADGIPLLVDIFCTTQFVGANSLTFFALMTCDTVDGTYRDLWKSDLFLPAELAPKKDPILTQMVPGGVLGAKRFLKLFIGAITADVTAGAISAAIRPVGL